MGLDITAFKNLTPAPDAVCDPEDGDEPVDWERFWRLRPGLIEWTDKYWPGRTEGLPPPGVYGFEKSLSFRAGSYSGYGAYRDWLAKVAGFRSARHVWRSGSPNTAFIEQIDFADNEGVIGPKVAAKLAKDYATYEYRAVKLAAETGDDGIWFLHQYHEWWNAFDLAANGGAVDFR